MADRQTFSGVLIKHDTLDATGIEVPFDVEALFGAKTCSGQGDRQRRRVSRLDRSHGRQVYARYSKDFRMRSGIAAGDNIVITVARDMAERTVETPADLAAARKQAWTTRGINSATRTKRNMRVRSKKQKHPRRVHDE